MSNQWWRDAVIYQVYPRSFADSDGDGTGDLPGIRSRLPYLRSLGVDAVWLSPFYASPQADGGYDVSDYRAVDPRYGTLDDARALISSAHELGLKIIADIVPNHSSDQHVWFQQALAEGPGSPMRSRYHFLPGRGENGEEPPNDWDSIFGGPAWTRVAETTGARSSGELARPLAPSEGVTARSADGEWYLHLFAPEQPDFNWNSPEVAAEFLDILRFWLDLGIDGFRIDVAHGLVKAEGLPSIGHADQLHLLGNDVMPFFDQDGVHEIYRTWRRVLADYPDRIFVAEAWTPTVARSANYVRPDELHQAFNFEYLDTAWDAAALRKVIDSSLDAMRPVGAPATWVLSNHDVTRHATRFANPPGSGTQIRSAGDRSLGLRRARAATLLMLALPGSAYVYQGEELGLPDVTDLPDEVRQDPSFHRANGQDGFRDGCRVPLPWTRSGTSYGFGDGGSWLPQPSEWGDLSVEAQASVEGSTLELYRSALKIRREVPGLGAGDAVTWHDEAPAGVLWFERDGFACTVNTTKDPVRIAAPGRVLLSSSGPVPVTDGSADLPGDTTVWWQL